MMCSLLNPSLKSLTTSRNSIAATLSSQSLAAFALSKYRCLLLSIRVLAFVLILIDGDDESGTWIFGTSFLGTSTVLETPSFPAGLDVSSEGINFYQPEKFK
jgi:hypothetical protein